MNNQQMPEMIEVDAESFRKMTGRMPLAKIVKTPQPQKIKWCKCHGEIPEHRGRCR